jgi:hypothetical protein
MRWSALREEDGSGCLYGYATRRELIDHACRLEEFGIWRYGLNGFPVYNYEHWGDDGVAFSPAQKMTPEKVAAHIDNILDPKPHPMKAEDRRAVASLLLPAFNALLKARDRAGSRYQPLHEEIADACDDVLSLMLEMYRPDFEQDSLAKISYSVSRLSDDRNKDVSTGLKSGHFRRFSGIQFGLRAPLRQTPPCHLNRRSLRFAELFSDAIEFNSGQATTLRRTQVEKRW